MTLPEPPDAELIRALAAGEESAFRVLYRRYTPRLRALVYRLLGGKNLADTDDAVQETWIRAVAGLARFRGESKLSTWLSSIAIRVTWEMIRQRRPLSELSDHDGPMVEPVETGERLDLEQALERLSHVQRMVVVLHDVEGYGHAEIAGTLAIAVATSRSHLFRARRALRVMLQSYARVSS